MKIISPDCGASVMKPRAGRDRVGEKYLKLKQMWETQLRCTDPNVVSDSQCCVCQSIASEYGRSPKTCSVCLASYHTRCFQWTFMKHQTKLQEKLFSDFDFSRPIAAEFRNDSVLCPSGAKLARMIPAAVG